MAKRLFLIMMLCAGSVLAAEEQAMTNADVIALVKAKLGSQIVAAKVARAAGQTFDLSTDGLLSLKKNNVPDEVISAMMKRQDTEAPPISATENVTDRSAPGPSRRTSKRENIGSRIFRAMSLTIKADASESCPSPGTFVEFSRVTTPGVAEDFVGCDVMTIADFVGMGTGNFIVQGAPSNALVFRALPPGQKGERNALSGENTANFIAIEKSKAEVLYQLKTGDKIKIRGGTFVAKTLLVGHSSVLFLAEAVERAK